MLELENQLEAIAVPPPEPVILGPAREEDAKDIQGESGIESGPESLLTVNSCIKVRLDLQADKSPIVVKGPFFPQVVNSRYQIRGTNV
jgi:hypothetical protein